MTSNQLSFYKNLETERSNRANEFETNRSNLAKETETNRANLEKERLNRYRADAQNFKDIFSGIGSAAKSIGSLV